MASSSTMPWKRRCRPSWLNRCHHSSMGALRFPTLPASAWSRTLPAPGPALCRTPNSPPSEQRFMRIDAVATGKRPPDDVNVISEVPLGGEPIKYEMDKAAGTLVVDRFLYTAMRYPGNYGFIPHTLSEDGDPCDVLVANTRAIVPGAVMSVRPVGVLFMEDEAGGDEKIIAVPSPKLTQRYANVKTY